MEPDRHELGLRNPVNPLAVDVRNLGHPVTQPVGLDQHLFLHLVELRFELAPLEDLAPIDPKAAGNLAERKIQYRPVAEVEKAAQEGTEELRLATAALNVTRVD